MACMYGTSQKEGRIKDYGYSVTIFITIREVIPKYLFCSCQVSGAKF